MIPPAGQKNHCSLFYYKLLYLQEEFSFLLQTTKICSSILTRGTFIPPADNKNLQSFITDIYITVQYSTYYNTTTKNYVNKYGYKIVVQHKYMYTETYSRREDDIYTNIYKHIYVYYIHYEGLNMIPI